MKNCRQYVLALLMTAAVLSVTACGSREDDTNNVPDQTTAGTTAGTSAGTAETSGSRAETSDEAGDATTGVIDGMMDDVKQGVDDLMGEDGTTAAGSTEATDK